MVSDCFVRFHPFWSAFYTKRLAESQTFFQISAFMHYDCHVNVHNHVITSCVHVPKKRLIFCRQQKIIADVCETFSREFFIFQKCVGFPQRKRQHSIDSGRAIRLSRTSTCSCLDFVKFILHDTVTLCTVHLVLVAQPPPSGKQNHPLST